MDKRGDCEGDGDVERGGGGGGPLDSAEFLELTRITSGGGVGNLAATPMGTLGTFGALGNGRGEVGYMVCKPRGDSRGSMLEGRTVNSLLLRCTSLC